MLKTILISVVVLAACAPGQPVVPDLNAINTTVAQTVAAASTQTAGAGIPVIGDGSFTPTLTPSSVEETPTAGVITLVPTIASSPTAILLSTPTALPGVVQVQVSVATNCRVGPGTAYTRVGALPVGQAAEVVGRHATRDYWVIRNPARTNETCWLWGEYATLTGDTTLLPVLTPPPLPTPVPDLDVSFEGLESCADTDDWWLDIALENNGDITFQSFFMIVTDTVTSTELSLVGNNFIDRDGCTVEENEGDLDPEDTFIVSSPDFDYDPSGHRIRARVTVCSNSNQSGTCLTESFDFIP